MSKEQFKKALHAIEQITSFEVNTEEHKALKEYLPLFESAYNLLESLENLIDTHHQTTNHDIHNIRKIIRYAKSKIQKV